MPPRTPKERREKRASITMVDTEMKNKRDLLKKTRIIICISGLPGCGKSTVAKRIAKHYGLKYVSGGDSLKALAIEAGYKPADRGWWETPQGLNFLKKRLKDPSFDKKVDEKLLEMAKEGNVVLDSWTMPWLLKEGFKIWLEASAEKRAERMAKRDGISFEKALALLKEREEKTKAIYEKLYGFKLGEDYSPFQLILDTNFLEADEVFEALCLVIDNFLLKKITKSAEMERLA